MRNYPPVRQERSADWESKERRDMMARKATSLIIQFCKDLEEVEKNKEKIIKLAKDYVDEIWEVYPDRDVDVPIIEQEELNLPINNGDNPPNS